jgi:hypothetical protein
MRSDRRHVDPFERPDRFPFRTGSATSSPCK